MNVHCFCASSQAAVLRCLWHHIREFPCRISEENDRPSVKGRCGHIRDEHREDSTSHWSKRGELAHIAYPARIESLILSDVLGDRLDVIASGPAVPDETTFEDALSVIDRYNLTDEIPANVLKLLREGAEGFLAETPKSGDPVLRW